MAYLEDMNNLGLSQQAVGMGLYGAGGDEALIPRSRRPTGADELDREHPEIDNLRTICGPSAGSADFESADPADGNYSCLAILFGRKVKDPNKISIIAVVRIGLIEPTLRKPKLTLQLHPLIDKVHLRPIFSAPFSPPSPSLARAVAPNSAVRLHIIEQGEVVPRGAHEFVPRVRNRAAFVRRVEEERGSGASSETSSSTSAVHARPLDAVRARRYAVIARRQRGVRVERAEEEEGAQRRRYCVGLF
ncbi:hypothetical protein B0H11DRAFT_2220158 [Mycena galericulata]|nr:hypothetical protein B0H11DRAFT_2220158 [Mycena galericulata]